MSLVLMTDKLVARLHFSSVFLTSYIVAGLTAALGSDSALRRHILCLVILLKHKGLVLQAENAHKISSFVSEHWLVTYFGFIPAGCLSLCPVLCPLLDQQALHLQEEISFYSRLKFRSHLQKRKFMPFPTDFIYLIQIFV